MRVIQRGSNTAYWATSFVLTLLLVLPVWLLAERSLRFAPELRAGDMLFKLRGRLPVRADMVIIAGDDRSVQELGRPPWPRRVYADIVNILDRAGARVIVLDRFFEERQLNNRASDAALWKAMADARNVHIPIIYGNPEKRQLDRDDLRGLKVGLERSAIHGRFGFEKTTPRYEWLGFDPPVSDYAVSAEGMGISTTDETNDIDGVLRRTKVGLVTQVNYPPNEPPTKLTGQPAVVPGLAVTAALDAFDLDKQFVSYEFGTKMLFGGDLNPPVWVPINALGQMTINYVGPPGSFPYYSLVDVRRGQVKPETFRGKIVLVGLTAANAEDADFRPTPFAPASPRVEITANALHSLLQRNPVRHEPQNSFPYLIAFGIALGALVPLFRVGVDALVAAVLFLLYLAFAVLALRAWSLLLPVLPALLLLLLAYAVMLLMHSLLRAPRTVVVQ